MMKIDKPSIPNGTRDFGPEKMLKRQFIIDAIKRVFEKYGFLPIETPAMENLSVLTGKYGEEGDQLLYKILNSGDFLSNLTSDDINQGSKSLAFRIAEKGLRYDLTVPFARFVVMNQHEIAFPFKRYQIQPVWRADRPQRGRYREFYQCDADVVGTDSLLSEAEIILMINEVFHYLGIPSFTIKINSRKILKALTEVIGAPGKETTLCIAIDKIDKIGKEKVIDELLANGFSHSAITQLDPILNAKGSNLNKFQLLESILQNSPDGMMGLGELKHVFEYLGHFGLTEHHAEIDLTLARGLSYYTGIIIEVKPNVSSITSSISGGGRYDNLTGVFGLPGISGVGISFGVDRIYDVMEELKLFPLTSRSSTKVMLANFDIISSQHAIGILTKLRRAGVKSELYPDATKLKKQMTYANKKGIPFVLMVGENEIKNQQYLLKNMETGEQETLALDDIIKKLSD